MKKLEVFRKFNTYGIYAISVCCAYVMINVILSLGM